MVKTSLSHNPYLLITKAKFNEEEPEMRHGTVLKIRLIMIS